MIDPQSKLTVLHDDNGTVSNHSDSAADYIRDEFIFSLSSTEDYLYVGYMKPFNATFVALTTPNVNANSLQAEYYNGTTWTSLSLIDETRGFTRSGFLFWDKSDMKQVSVGGISKYYIRIRPSADHSATTYRGINILFADDNALKQEFFEVDNQNLLPSGESSHLVQHVGARNMILQMLRNKGILKQSSGSSSLKDLTAFDLHNLEQVRQAAVMLTLSKIFFMLSDSKEDTWWSKYEEYQDKFEESFELLLLALDTDDDGQEDVSETNEPFKVQRWLR
jgi:hypothetical protein